MRWWMKRRMVVLGVAAVFTAAALLSMNAGDAGNTTTAKRGAARDPLEPSVDPAASTTTKPSAESEKEQEEEEEEGEDARGPGIVQLNFMGRLGNNLFEYAAARVVADRMGGWALSLQAAVGNAKKFSTLLRPEGMACFPGVRPLGGSRITSPEMKALAAAPFRNLRIELKDTTPRRIVMQDWYQNFQLFSEDRDRLRQIMAFNQSCCGSTAPGENDIVIHHRNYRAELTAEQYDKLHFKDLGYDFYHTVLGDLAVNGDAGAGKRPVGTIWVVGELDEGDPLVARLRQEHENIRLAEHTQGQFEAFCFLARAPRLVMAHSTFSWWAAFLGNATEIHFPLSPTRLGVTGPQIKVTGDPRYVYRGDTGQVVVDPGTTPR